MSLRGALARVKPLESARGLQAGTVGPEVGCSELALAIEDSWVGSGAGQEGGGGSPPRGMKTQDVRSQQ